jgi:acyl-CoA synthetase (AMP-forming)/AMP-acid ligase II
MSSASRGTGSRHFNALGSRQDPTSASGEFLSRLPCRGVDNPIFLPSLPVPPAAADYDSPFFSFTHIIRIDGTTYQGILHILGVSRAGYIPLLLHFPRSSGTSLVVELLRQANALALIYDTPHMQSNRSSSSPFASLPIPVYPNSDLREVEVSSNCRLPKIGDLLADPNAVAFVLHTAGTTMGTPKLVPYSHRTIDSIMRRAQVIASPTSSRRQDTYVLK